MSADHVTAIKCPSCARTVATVAPCVKSLYDKAFHCKCGVAGTLVWRRGTDAVIRGRKGAKDAS